MWHEDNGTWTHKGAGLLFYKMPAKGIYNFTVELLKGGNLFGGGKKIRWVFNYIDKQNYDQFELDNKSFTTKVVSKGKTTERGPNKLKDLEKQKSFTIQIDVGPDHIVHKMSVGGTLVDLDTWAEPGQNLRQANSASWCKATTRNWRHKFQFPAEVNARFRNDRLLTRAAHTEPRPSGSGHSGVQWQLEHVGGVKFEAQLGHG